jgi:FtsP/CotA-like multicopper oxidase with cupredoxin domain
MKRITRNFPRTGVLLLAGFMLALILSVQGEALARPGLAPSAVPQMAMVSGLDCTTSPCHLYATTGILPLPGVSSVEYWGYGTASGTPQLPGPTIIANQGETVEVILHNELAEKTALIFPGQAMPLDLTGVDPGMDNSATPYSFTASNPGTYLYEAGLLPGAQYQVAMGLYGALIVRPTGLPPAGFAGLAYDSASAYHDEALLVLSEIDPALNDSADPAAFDMRDYEPRYWLINGQAYPDIVDTASAAGNEVLLRYVNAGIVQHSMGALGVVQEILAIDGNPLDYPYTVAAATIGSGQTSDRMVTVPALAPSGSKYALYDTSMLLHNNGADGFGGMMTFLAVGGVAPQPTGPTTSAVFLTPDRTDSSVGVLVEANISSGVTGAEFLIDTQIGSGTPMTYNATSGKWEGTIGADLLHGDHTIYVHGSDGTWGAFNFAVLHVDQLGPDTSSISLAPNPSDGSAQVFVSATGNDTAKGNSDITAAEYSIDDAGFTGSTCPVSCNMSVNFAEPIASLDGDIDATAMSSLVEGEHTVYVHSMDSFGHWSDPAMAPLKVDMTGPDALSVIVTPPLLYSRAAVRVDATFTDPLNSDPLYTFLDVNSDIQRAEGFINTVGPDGTGFPMTPRDGLYNSSMEEAYAFIPFATINALLEGPNTIYVHAQDSSGNWGDASLWSVVLDIKPNAIFADGFESGNVSAWAASAGVPLVSGAAARTGMYGMEVTLAGTSLLGYVIDDSPTAEPGYHARFYFNPNSTETGNNGRPDIFVGFDAGANALFRVQYNRTNKGVYRVRAIVTHAGGTSTTGWADINNDWTAIEIAWQSANPATFRLYTDGFLRQMVNGVDTSGFELESVWLGPSGNLANQVSGTMYFDDFVSTRNTYIGP